MGGGCMVLVHWDWRGEPLLASARRFLNIRIPRKVITDYVTPQPEDLRYFSLSNFFSQSFKTPTFFFFCHFFFIISLFGSVKKGNC